MMRVAGKDPIISKRYPKEGEYADALDVDVPDDYTGADMPEAFENRQWDKIKEHVNADVKESMLMFIKRKGMMMETFHEHYDIDAQGPPVQEIGMSDDSDGSGAGGSSLIEEIDLDLDES